MTTITNLRALLLSIHTLRHYEPRNTRWATKSENVGGSPHRPEWSCSGCNWWHDGKADVAASYDAHIAKILDGTS